MDIGRKLEIVKTAIASIAEHSDADSVVIQAALDETAKMVGDAKAGVSAKNAKDAAAAISPKSSS